MLIWKFHRLMLDEDWPGYFGLQNDPFLWGLGPSRPYLLRHSFGKEHQSTYSQQRQSDRLILGNDKGLNVFLRQRARKCLPLWLGAAGQHLQVKVLPVDVIRFILKPRSHCKKKMETRQYHLAFETSRSFVRRYHGKMKQSKRQVSDDPPISTATEAWEHCPVLRLSNSIILERGWISIPPIYTKENIDTMTLENQMNQEGHGYNGWN